MAWACNGVAVVASTTALARVRVERTILTGFLGSRSAWSDELWDDGEFDAPILCPAGRRGIGPERLIRTVSLGHHAIESDTLLSQVGLHGPRPSQRERDIGGSGPGRIRVAGDLNSDGGVFDQRCGHLVQQRV